MGWNSTLIVHIKGSVLCPFQFPMEWNSAGYCALFKAYLDRFQFPTGWNSTLWRSAGNNYNPGFNSQRDGILLTSFFPSHPELKKFQFLWERLPAQFILINKVLDLSRQIYSTKARNLPRRINSAKFYFTLFISISPSCAPISIRSPVLISSPRIISAILSSTRS